jgi:hypothetical protein
MVSRNILLVGVLEVGDLGFHRGTQRDHLGALGGGVGAHDIQVRVVLEAVLGDVGRVQHRLGGDQAEGLDAGPFFLGQVERTHGLALVELGEALLEHRDQESWPPCHPRLRGAC